MTVVRIEPFKYCGPINAGDDYSEIIKRFSDHQEFKKGPLSKFVTSSILAGNLHVFYSEKGSCVGVEVFPPLKPSLDVIDFFSSDLNAVNNLLSKRGVKVEISDSGLEIPSLGISLYSHDFDESLCCAIDSVYVDLSKPE